MSKEYDDIFKRVTGSGTEPVESTPSGYDSVWQEVTRPPVVTEEPTTRQPASISPYMEGRSETDRAKLVPVRVMGTNLNGLTFGFGDEILGGVMGAYKTVTGEGPQTFSENYRNSRDYVRGVMDQYRQDYPVSSTVANVSASVPTIMLNPVGKGATSVISTASPRAGAFMRGAVGTGFGANAGRAAITGAGYGTLAGVGDSRGETVRDIATDAALGGISGAVIAPVLLGGTNILGAGVSNVAQRVSQGSADDYASQKVAEAISRDAQGTVFQNGQSNPVNQSIMRLRRLGPEARVVDAGGQNTRQLLDTVATLPGQTKNAVESVIHTRQAGRGTRLVQAADTALRTGGAGFQQTLDALDLERQGAAKPFYDQLRNVAFTVDDDLALLLKKTSGMHREAEQRYLTQTGQRIDLSKIQKGQQVPFSVLDTLKATLYDGAEALKREGKGGFARDVDSARRSLIDRLDALSPKTSDGQSIYKLARDAYAGPSQLIDAAELGRKAMKGDVFDIGSAVRGMSKSEQEAFRVGALQALREKAGTQSGQTNLLKMWMEPATQQRLKVIFGSDYRSFAAAVAKEARLKGVETVGRGSQTAARQSGMGDLDIAPLADATEAVTGAFTGNKLGAVNGVVNLWNRVATPEPVRNRMGEILLSQGLKGTENLQNLRDLVVRINREQAIRAGRLGAGTGLASGGLVNSGLIGSALPGQSGGLLGN